NGITQILETAGEYGFAGEDWTTLRHDSDRLARTLRRIEMLEEMAFAVGRLERWQHEARERLENRLAEAQPAPVESSYTAPLGSEYRPHQYTYKTNDDLNPDTVLAHKDYSPDPARAAAEPDRAGEATAQAAPVRTDSGTVMRLSIDELLLLAPRL